MSKMSNDSQASRRWKGIPSVSYASLNSPNTDQFTGLSPYRLLTSDVNNNTLHSDNSNALCLNRKDEQKDDNKQTNRERIQSVTSSTDSVFCRICHQDDSDEALLHMCKCSGTMGLIHKSCIERWLGTVGKDKCELCGFNFKTERIKKPLYEWLTHQSSRTDRQNLLADCACFLVLTPMASISTWLCISGAQYYYNEEAYTHDWRTWGLTTLTVFLIMIYMVWCSVALKYHVHAYHTWQEANLIVRVVDSLDEKECSSLSRNDSNTSSNSGQRLVEITSLSDITETVNAPSNTTAGYHHTMV